MLGNKRQKKTFKKAETHFDIRHAHTLMHSCYMKAKQECPTRTGNVACLLFLGTFLKKHKYR